MNKSRFLFFCALLAAVILGGWMALNNDSPYIAERSDNICGLQELYQLSHPAKVDYPSLIASTPEWKKIEREGIDPESASGSVLQARARARTLEACNIVRRAKHHCSIWRAIRRKDKKAIPDVTRPVLIVMKKLQEDERDEDGSEAVN